MFFRKKIKEDENYLIVSDNSEIADVRKIAIPDLKQYLIKGYEEIRQEKFNNERLKEQLENAKEFKSLYESALAVSEEYEKRDSENKEKIEKLQQEINRLKSEIYNKDETINNYRIREEELENKEERIDKIYEESIIESEQYIKQKIIAEINQCKGNISKGKIISIIEEVK